MDLVGSIVSELMSLRSDPVQIQPFSDRYADFDLACAYRVVARIRDLRIAAGEKPVGRKIGFTNRSIWRTHGISAPVWNYVFDQTVAELDAGQVRFDPSGFPEPRIEPEVVLHLRSAPRPEMTLEDLAGCVDWAAPGFELVYSVFPGWRFTAADAAAAFGVHARLFVGERLELGPDPSAAPERLAGLEVLLQGGKGASREGSGVNVLGGPIQALKFLVRELDRMSTEPLRAGEIVSTGTLTEAMPVRSGQSWSVSFEGIEFKSLRIDII